MELGLALDTVVFFTLMLSFSFVMTIRQFMKLDRENNK